MPSALRFDARGRITIPKSIRKGLGKEFVAIRMPKGIVLYPIPKHIEIPTPAGDVTGEDEAEREVDDELRGR